MKAYRKEEVDNLFNSWQNDLNQLDVVDAVIIPDNATNGDMFVEVFKPYKVVVHSAQVQVYLTEQKWQMFGISWWNAPYKGNKEE